MDTKISNKNSQKKLIIRAGEKFQACYDTAKIRTLYSDRKYSFIAIVVHLIRLKANNLYEGKYTQDIHRNINV